MDAVLRKAVGANTKAVGANTMLPRRVASVHADAAKSLPSMPTPREPRPSGPTASIQAGVAPSKPGYIEFMCQEPLDSDPASRLAAGS